MPMDFPDMRSLKMAARAYGFRGPNDKEDEADYRRLLADFVSSEDLIASEEIRNSCGWDKWSEIQKGVMLLRGMAKK